MEDNINIEDISSVQKRICISVSPESVNKKFDDFFTTVSKDANIKGFRKGKVPINILKSLYSERAKGFVSELLVSEFYSKAIKEHNLNPLKKPDVESTNNSVGGSFNDDNSYFVSLLVEVLPKLEPKEYKGMKLKLTEFNREKLLSERFNEYRTQFAEKKQILDRPAKLGDTVVLDFRGFLDGSPFAGGEAKGYSLNLGSNSFVQGFEDKLVGMNVGEEKIIEVKFPDDYSAKNLASKDTTFEIKIHSIIETKLAELNDDLALMVGVNSVEELTTSAKKDVDEYIDKETRNQAEKQILSKLFEVNQFEVPKSMVDGEVSRLLGTNKNPDINLLNAIQSAAKQNVQRAILLDAIYENEKDMEITPDELDKLLESYAVKNNISKDDLVSNLYNTNQMDAFMGILKTKKAIDFIIQHSEKIKE